MDKSTIILRQDTDLKGKDLSRVYRHYTTTKELPGNPARFKKKESLETMAKSILKHRIQSLTDKNMTAIETEIGYVSPDGTGLTVDMLRRLAHFLILEACGELENLPMPVLPKAHVQEKVLTPARRKRPLVNEDNEMTSVITEQEPIGKRLKKSSRAVDDDSFMSTPPSARSTRKSLAPDVLRKMSSSAHKTELPSKMSVEEQNVGCRLKAHNATKSSVGNIKANNTLSDIDSLNLGPNPTQQMIARKRRSLANSGRNVSITSSHNTPSKVGNISMANNDIQEPMVIFQEEATPSNDYVVSKKKSSPSMKMSQKANVSRATKIPTAMPPLIGYPGIGNNEIFLAESQISSLKYEDIKKQIQTFTGATLTVLHTPCDWGALEVFNLVMSIRQLNRKASVTTFSVLVGCGLENLHLFHEALCRQTKQVQFVVFEREDRNLEQPGQLLRDVNSFFLLAYFFPGCENEDQSNVAIPQMVRSGATTCFHTKSSEDLENNIVHSLSEEGDWIVDLCCAGRELALAAQKMGRNAIAIHNDPTSLVSLHEKASAIAKHHDTNFRIGTDGVILKLN